MTIKLTIDGKEIDLEGAEVIIKTIKAKVNPPITRDTISPPQFLAGPPGGWHLFEDEDWAGYPLGPVERFHPLKWERKFSHDSEYLNDDKEQCVFVTPKVTARGVQYNPHSIVDIDGERWLAITPRKTPTEEFKESGYRNFQTGVLSSAREFTYGYSESEHMCPLFDGAWSASWMMGPSLWPEIDAFEHVAKVHGKDKLFCAIHSRNPSTGNDVGMGADIMLVNATTDRPAPFKNFDLDRPFKSAALWTPNFIATYINNKLVWWTVNPQPSDENEGLHSPGHRVFSLAITGESADSWGGATYVDPAKLSPFYTRAIKTWAMP